MTFSPTRTSPSESFNRLEGTLMSKVSGASQGALYQEMANTFQAFCRETHVWREQVERNLIQGLSTYELSPSRNDAVVNFIISVEVNDKPYRPMGGQAFTRHTYGGYRVAPDYTSIELHPTPTGDVAKGLKAFVGLSLKATSLDLPCEIIDHYFETIQDGVLERMYGHKNRPYSDTEESKLRQRKFHAGVTRVRRDVRGGNAQASPPWLFPQTAPGRPKRGGRSYGW